MASGEEDQPVPSKNQNAPQPERKHWLEYAIFGFVILTALATGCAAWYARQQWLTAEDNEKRSLRAYVFVESATLVTENGMPKGLRVDGKNTELFVNYKLVNVGQTPAYNVTRLLSLPLREYPLQHDIPIEATNGTSAYLTKSQSFGPVSSRGFTDPEMVTILRPGDQRLYFAGLISYFDIFHEPKETRFCFMYVRTLSGFEFVDCDRWNPADKISYAN
jgi:hypothetical protein